MQRPHAVNKYTERKAVRVYCARKCIIIRVALMVHWCGRDSVGKRSIQARPLWKSSSQETFNAIAIRVFSVRGASEDDNIGRRTCAFTSRATTCIQQES